MEGKWRAQEQNSQNCPDRVLLPSPHPDFDASSTEEAKQHYRGSQDAGKTSDDHA